MASAAVLLLKFQHSIGVTVKDDDTWTVDSDPHGMLAQDGGKWTWGPGYGTRLNDDAGVELITLQLWQLSHATKGQKGYALFNPSIPHASGNFEVQTVVD
jgi:hypothetical protein